MIKYNSDLTFSKYSLALVIATITISTGLLIVIITISNVVLSNYCTENITLLIYLIMEWLKLNLTGDSSENYINFKILHYNNYNNHCFVLVARWFRRVHLAKPKCASHDLTLSQ